MMTIPLYKNDSRIAVKKVWVGVKRPPKPQHDTQSIMEKHLKDFNVRMLATRPKRPLESPVDIKVDYCDPADTSHPIDSVMATVAVCVSLANGKQPRRANRLIFSILDSWLRDGKSAPLVDKFFAKLDVSDIPAEVIVAPLAVTLKAKSILDHATRANYVARARMKMEQEIGKERTAKLLARYA